jgi:hypothetical protein
LRFDVLGLHLQAEGEYFMESVVRKAVFFFKVGGFVVLIGKNFSPQVPIRKIAMKSVTSFGPPLFI